MKNNVTRRTVLMSGAKYAAIAPATTVLVAKSARAGGSGPGPYTGPGGVIVTQASDCPILISAPGQVTHCLAHFAGG